MTELKTQKTRADVTKYIASIDDPARRNDAQELLKLISEATGEKPVMWGDSIISFGTTTYKYANGKQNEWMRVGFSARKQNTTVYIMTGFDEYAAASGYNPKPLLDKLGPYKTGKSCLYIKRLDDIDKNILKKLVKESYEHNA